MRKMMKNKSFSGKNIIELIGFITSEIDIHVDGKTVIVCCFEIGVDYNTAAKKLCTVDNILCTFSKVYSY